MVIVINKLASCIYNIFTFFVLSCTIYQLRYVWRWLCLILWHVWY